MKFLSLFAFGTVFLAFFSWRISIKARRYHGIARFFAFESILALFLFNVRFWFKNPFSVLQILSWILLGAALFLAVQGAYLLIKLGKPKGQIENTTRLVVRGVYKYIRHPLYGSLILLGLGIFLKRVTAWTSLGAVVDVVAAYLTAKIEEKEMRARFGEEYAAYMKRTKMFVPFLV